MTPASNDEIQKVLWKKDTLNQWSACLWLNVEPDQQGINTCRLNAAGPSRYRVPVAVRRS